MALVQQGDMEMPNLQAEIERDSNFLSDTLRIQSFVKEFPNLDMETKKERPMNRAVNGLSLSIFRDQILVLLGHNGAGKTTTISMLQGEKVPTEGSASVFGLDMLKQRDLANQIIGICPQEDVLLTNMTVMENLYYFCGMKLMPVDEIIKYADHWLEKLDLT